MRKMMILDFIPFESSYDDDNVLLGLCVYLYVDICVCMYRLGEYTAPTKQKKWIFGAEETRKV